VATSFNQQLDQHGAWRRSFTTRLKLLGDWMRDNELLDAALEDRLHGLEMQVRADKVMVAFVAEFSRGKSELINAIFFSGYGRRIMPASAGRTTMCPTELGYDADLPPCLRLLSIASRALPQSLMEWRLVPEKWTHIDLDVDNAEQLATALQKVSETLRVSQAQARAWGFWHEDTPADNPITGPDGLVEVPRWRHALINLAHPLLKQGLVVLDTPGLNAIGAEPELTVNLIPEAQAVVFILGADTGVTKSDLLIWQEHLATQTGGEVTRLVVLNKIDTLWDALSTPEQVQAQIEKQRATTAAVLGLPASHVIPVSAQKGLIAKVTGNERLLKASRLPELEHMLAQGLLGQRRHILQTAVMSGVSDLQAEAERVINARRRDLTEQKQELGGLQGKNAAVVRQMRLRIKQERAEFAQSGVRIHAVRSVHTKLLYEAIELLGTNTLKSEFATLQETLRQPGLKFGVKKVYSLTFERLRAILKKVCGLSAEIDSMLKSAFLELNTEFGFTLKAPSPPDLTRLVRDIEATERSHVQYLSVGNVFRLAQPEFSTRLVQALATRVRALFEGAQMEVEAWNKAAMAQLDVQLRERRRNFERRIESIERIEQAAGSLDERIAEIRQREEALLQLENRLQELAAQFIREPAPDVLMPATPDVPVGTQ
jgi:hypothetical protein